MIEIQSSADNGEHVNPRRVRELGVVARDFLRAQMTPVPTVNEQRRLRIV